MASTNLTLIEKIWNTCARLFEAFTSHGLTSRAAVYNAMASSFLFCLINSFPSFRSSSHLAISSGNGRVKLSSMTMKTTIKSSVGCYYLLFRTSNQLRRIKGECSRRGCDAVYPKLCRYPASHQRPHSALPIWLLVFICCSHAFCDSSPHTVYPPGILLSRFQDVRNFETSMASNSTWCAKGVAGHVLIDIHASYLIRRSTRRAHPPVSPR